ncbi:hypothetical protein Neosp_004738 [[Neocosmospora] mangrovei]
MQEYEQQQQQRRLAWSRFQKAPLVGVLPETAGQGSFQRVTQSCLSTGHHPFSRAAPPQTSLFPPRTGLPGETRTLSPRASC